MKSSTKRSRRKTQREEAEEEDMEIVFRSSVPPMDPPMPIPRSLKDNKERDCAIGDLTGLVKKGLDRPVEHQPQQDAFTTHPIIRWDLIDSEGNLRATEIGITWESSDTFLHVKVVGLNATGLPGKPRPATSTPYQPVREHVECSMSTPRQPLVQPT